MSITSYKLLTAGRADDLVPLVAAAIANGEQPIGPPVLGYDGRLAQCMIVGRPVSEIAMPAPVDTAGAAEEGVDALESGDDILHLTRLEFDAFALGDSGDNANLALGALAYTFPAGDILVYAASLDAAVTLDNATQTDTPEVGLGTVVGSGANATLGAVGATSEDIFEGEAIGSVDGTDFIRTGKFPTGGKPLLIKSDDPHTVYVNVADGWADISGASALSLSGNATLLWARLNTTPAP